MPHGRHRATPVSTRTAPRRNLPSKRTGFGLAFVAMTCTVGFSAVTATTPAAAATAITLQVDTPDAAALARIEGQLRGVPGVQSVATTSLALGGVSLMRVGFAGDPAGLRALLETRGWIVLGNGATLRIRRSIITPPAGAEDGAAPGG